MAMSSCDGPAIASSSAKKIRIPASPYAGEADFSVLNTFGVGGGTSIDMVSLADLLRNSFVYPPHTIYNDVNILTTGFAVQHGTQDELRFHLDYQSAAATMRPPSHVVSDDALLRSYHQRLAQAVERCTTHLKSPWFLQSGGKDSTSMAIAVADVVPMPRALRIWVAGRRTKLNRRVLWRGGLVCVTNPWYVIRSALMTATWRWFRACLC